jgi:hypothetical protein
MDASEMRRRAAECRVFARTAVAAEAIDTWLKAAEEWNILALEADALSARAAIVETQDGTVPGASSAMP